MNKETYEALKRIVASYYQKQIANDTDIVIIEDWIEEVAKEYDEDDKLVPTLNDTITNE